MNQVTFEERPEGTSTMSPEMQNATRYYAWTVSQFLPYMGDHILDIGGGFGAHLEHILPHKPRVTSVELSAAHVRYMNERFSTYPHFSAHQIDFGADSIDALVAAQYDTIISLNVLEHIEDDRAALDDMHRILRAQHGTLLLQVPALRWLYGSMDHQAGHYRRYTVGELRDKLAAAGFVVQRCYYFNIFGVLPWFMSGRIFKKPLEDDSVNWQIRAFNALTPTFKQIERVLPLPMGQSVMAVAKVV